MLEFEGGQDLDNFITQLKIGGVVGGNRKKSRDQIPNPEPYDFPIPINDLENDNLLHFHCESFGSKGKNAFGNDPNTNVLTLNTKYYTFGRCSDNHEGLPLKWQIQIARLISGTVGQVAISTR